MSLKEKIKQDLNSALKNGKTTDVSALRQLLAVALNKEKEKRFKLSKEKLDIKEEELQKESQLSEEELAEVISSEAKKRKESILEFEKGGRKELADKEKEELKILQGYLPEQMSEEELNSLAREAIGRVGAQSVKDIGKVMAELMPKVKGRADGNSVSKTVKELLGDDRSQ